MSGLLVTATGTGTGKTIVCGQLAAFLARRNLNVTTQKWVQTGCDGYAEDLAAHDRIAGPDISAPEELRCPSCFRLPASPHLAAAEKDAEVDIAEIKDAFSELERTHDAVLVEGVGGALVPLTEDVLLADLTARLGLPAIVVIQNTLGCINHALLTVEAIASRNIPVLGLIFNHLPGVDDRPEVLEDNPRIISAVSGVPVLGRLPALKSPETYTPQIENTGHQLLTCWREHTRNE